MAGSYIGCAEEYRGRKLKGIKYIFLIFSETINQKRTKKLKLGKSKLKHMEIAFFTNVLAEI